MSYRLLVVEDEPLSRDMLVRRLRTRGFEVEEAADGQAALDYLEAQRVDLVLLDLAMPRVGGLEVIKALRARWSQDSLPIIVVSAKVDSDDVVEALDAGANDYVIKPINFKVLLARVRTCLRMRQTVSLLVEAERQRVMMDSLAKSASKVARPLADMVPHLETLLLNPPADPAMMKQELEQILGLTEQTAGVIHEIRQVGLQRDISYTRRLEMLDDVTGRPHDPDTRPR